MTVTENIDRDTRGHVEITLAILADQISALASHRPHATPRVDGHERRDGHRNRLLEKREISSESLRKRKSGPSGPPETWLYRRALGSVNRCGICVDASPNQSRLSTDRDEL
jgi:hypothetical protein